MAAAYIEIEPMWMKTLDFINVLSLPIAVSLYQVRSEKWYCV